MVNQLAQFYVLFQSFCFLRPFLQYKRSADSRRSCPGLSHLSLCNFSLLKIKHEVPNWSFYHTSKPCTSFEFASLHIPYNTCPHFLLWTLLWERGCWFTYHWAFRWGRSPMTLVVWAWCSQEISLSYSSCVAFGTRKSWKYCYCCARL